MIVCCMVKNILSMDYDELFVNIKFLFGAYVRAGLHMNIFLLNLSFLYRVCVCFFLIFSRTKMKE